LTRLQKIRSSVLLAWIAAILLAQTPADSRRRGSLASPRPVVGAIRWDAWHGKRGVPGRAVEASLAPAKWHYRLPFFAKAVSESEVSIDGASQEANRLPGSASRTAAPTPPEDGADLRVE